MKEYTYEVEHSWEKQRRPVVVDHHHRQRHQQQHQHQRHFDGDDAAMDADASSMSGMYKHLYSVASFYVYLKLRNKKKTEQRSAVLYVYTAGMVLLMSFVTRIYELITNLLQ
jgi:hypothetical protein